MQIITTKLQNKEQTLPSASQPTLHTVFWERRPVSQSDTTSLAVTFAAEAEGGGAGGCGVVVFAGGDGGEIVDAEGAAGADVGGVGDGDGDGDEVVSVFVAVRFPLEAEESQQLSNCANSLGCIRV